MILGLGLGHDGYGEYSAFGEPLTDDRARAEALDRGIELLVPALTGGPVPQAGGRRTTPAGIQRPRVPIWVAGRPGRRAGPRRVDRHALDGLALVGGGTWTPADVAAALDAAGRQPGDIDVVLVGGDHRDVGALGRAGATWCIVERGPGTTAADAQGLATARP